MWNFIEKLLHIVNAMEPQLSQLITVVKVPG